MQGDYFAWLSHDDLHLPHKTSAQIAFLDKLGRPDACLFSDFDFIGPDDEPISTIALPAERIRQNPRLPLYNGMINGCTLLIPAGLMKEFGPFDESLRCTQDYDLWNRILAQHEFFHQPEVLIRYRIHPGQDSNKPRAVTEGDALWKSMLSSRSEVERAQMFGSTRRYFSTLAAFLEDTPYKGAAANARARASSGDAEVCVSVVIPFFNDVPQALLAVQSALSQSHQHLEVILVNNGSTDDVSPLAKLVANDPRVFLLSEPITGSGSAWGRALMMVHGDYIAFLEATDRFIPHKIARQLDQMQRHGALFSHTSYYLLDHGDLREFGTVHSGLFEGHCYPKIIGHCPIMTSTVMLHRSIVDAGCLWSCESGISRGVPTWIDLAMRYMLLGLDEPLTIADWTRNSVTLNPAGHIARLTQTIEEIDRHPIHRRYTSHTEKLRETIRASARQWVAAGRQIEAVKTQVDLLDAQYSAHPAFFADGNGRTSPAQVNPS